MPELYNEGRTVKALYFNSEIVGAIFSGFRLDLLRRHNNDVAQAKYEKQYEKLPQRNRDGSMFGHVCAVGTNIVCANQRCEA